jgi:23S rRNA U2552 (ribose-2'-O)-methylase RlmE/FtsJ
MTIQLRLDGPALAALFPEGTEARIELQKAVVAEFVRKHMTAAVPEDVKKLVVEQRAKAVQDVLREFGGISTFGVQLTPIFKDAVRNEVRKAVHEFVTQQLQASLAETTKDLLSETDTYVRKHVEIKTDEAIDKAVRARFDSALKKI